MKLNIKMNAESKIELIRLFKHFKTIKQEKAVEKLWLLTMGATELGFNAGMRTGVLIGVISAFIVALLMSWILS